MLCVLSIPRFCVTVLQATQLTKNNLIGAQNKVMADLELDVLCNQKENVRNLSDDVALNSK